MDRLTSMRAFQRVVDEGSFAAAARALDLSPAAVTRLIGDLEEHLGARLLQRTTRRLSLTDAGSMYLSRVRNILQDIDEADALTSSRTHELAGVLRVLTSPVLASHVLAPLVADFRQSHPTIILEIEVDSQRNPAVEDYDVTLLGVGADFDADIIARKIIESDAVLVASPAYLKRRGTPRNPEDLAKHDCLRLKTTEGRLSTLRMWRPEDLDDARDLIIEPVLWANHTDTLLRAALDGAGITSVSVDLVAPYLNEGKLARVLRPWITGRLAMYAALPSRKFVPARTRVFLNYLIERTRDLSSKALEACMVC